MTHNNHYFYHLLHLDIFTNFLGKKTNNLYTNDVTPLLGVLRVDVTMRFVVIKSLSNIDVEGESKQSNIVIFSETREQIIGTQIPSRFSGSGT